MWCVNDIEHDVYIHPMILVKMKKKKIHPIIYVYICQAGKNISQYSFVFVLCFLLSFVDQVFCEWEQLLLENVFPTYDSCHLFLPDVLHGWYIT